MGFDNTQLEPGIVIEAPDYRLECYDLGTKITLRKVNLSYSHSFVKSALATRARQSGQAVLKACNNKKRSIRRVLDVTGGWGADSLTLALHGREVTLLEYNPLVFNIVDYSTKCWMNLPLNHNGSLSAQHQTALTYLDQSESADAYDCIYLDPMFPAHKSSAKPSKEMQILQVLTENLEIETSFEKSLERAKQRVVVKRPLKAEPLTRLKPDFCIREKTIRFDIYLTA
ncbi:MAG: class I SAM-dependent methyltransferase [Pseudomonadota bacterium]